MREQALYEVRSLCRVGGVSHGGTTVIVFTLLPAYEYRHVELAVAVGVLTEGLINIEFVVSQLCIQYIATLVAVNGAIGACP